ncbi:uncharacterized protein K441DRAFT_650634 [Cenococcum geophilum 1.58]|uniref:uncharacterized protein n=1 Tax=Cenococcum geophilum 1.58 TaxID=794803 RepID=UPI0035902234|nr:hypothetical protein K441DRAFT_650634 [Cenococcum geophilum 1.58]
MTGHLPESFLPRDDIVSISSSTGDSGYNSQSDATRRLTSATEGYQTRSSEESRSRMVEPFLGNSMYSPSLSPDSQNAFHGSQSDVNQMLLPPATGDSDIGDNPFGMSDFANYSTGQGYSQFDNSALPRFFTPTSEVEVAQSWTSDAQTFSAPFAVRAVDANTSFSAPFADRAVDANTFLPFRQTPQMSRDTIPQSYYPPYVYQSQDAPRSNFGVPANSNQRRPRARRPQLDTTSLSLDTASESTPLSAGQHDSRRTSNTEQVFRSFMSASMMSPTCSVISNPQHASIAGSDFTEQSTHFVDISKVEKEESIAGSIVAPSIKDDDLEEEGFSPSQSSAAQNSLEEIEGKLARTHPLYQAQQKEDNLFHCPNEGQSGCTHKPTKLKCNYDKYVDSHLRPFRCKVKSCVGVQFSSTACLLRHEREAHGMHGHGSKPHLCTYADCERSLPGNGFPRRYNLFDHMKRVHDYTGSTSPPEQVPPPVQPAQPGPKRHNSTHKRKPAPPVEDMTKKRQKATTTKAPSAATAAASTQHRLAQEKQKLQSEWAERRVRLQQRLENIQGPQDINSHLQANEDLAALSKIAARLNELG